MRTLEQPIGRAVLTLATAFALCGFACNEPGSQPPSSEQAAAPAPAPAPEPAEPEPPPKPEPPPEPAPPPEPVGGPHCDQRELAGKDGEPKRMCVDFGELRGAAGPRCFEGGELSKGSCPDEGAVASCTLPTTGVVLRYYEGKDLDAARRDCETIEGEFESP